VAARKPAKLDAEARLVRSVNVQLLKNLVIWGELQELGAGDAPELRLTFAYVAPDEARAERLAAFLEAETDYELHVRRRGRVGGRRWFVAGATQPAAVSLETLNTWTEWMIAAGAEHGSCRFDGWAPQDRD
jgi:Zn ribbon nucleic-acid-binding protein